MKVIITGYGRMGREIERVLGDRGHEVTARIDPTAPDADNTHLTQEALKQADGVIEFSLPGGLRENIGAYCRQGIPAVIGTTGWEDQRTAVREQVEAAGSGLMWGSNFSVGAHIFWNLAGQAAALVKDIEDYDLMVHEFHHRGKKDSPSGTALTTAEVIQQNCPRKSRVVTERLDRQPHPEELHVSSTRGGSIPGTHQVLLDSEADTVEVRHTARNRRGFALGAVMGLEWLQNRRGFYPVEDFIEELLRSPSRG